MTSGLSITVDVDGEAGLPDGGQGFGDRLTSRSERAYGLLRGLPRVLRALAEADAQATFYVPGVTALRHPHEIAELAADGHEVQHHGHAHRRPDTMDDPAQRADVEHGLDALAEVTGTRPLGYRAPGWELTHVTLRALVQGGFTFDSSLMGDDRPYPLQATGASLIELPVHWSLDDAPHFARTTDPHALLDVWLAELDAAHEEQRHLTVTLHPEILGRPHRVDVLRRLLARAAGRGVPVLTHGHVAALVAPRL